MKDKILKIASVLLPVLLVGLAIWCLLSKDQHFPWLGAMIKKSERQQADLKKKIRQQEELIKSREPAARELFFIRENSFTAGEDIIGQLRGRVERIFNASGARVRTIGTPRRLKSNSTGIELYEISLTAELKTNELEIVMQEFSKPPCLLWRSITARPNNMLKPEFLSVNLIVSAAGFEKTQPATGVTDE